MREIKFLAWDGRKMSKPFSLADASYEGFPSPVVDDHGECRTDVEMLFLQFAGLKDKNGVEIFEGDILSSPNAPAENTRHIVKWSNKYSGWYAENIKSRREGDGSLQLWVYINSIDNNCFMFGNIYENPDLLEPDL